MTAPRPVFRKRHPCPRPWGRWVGGAISARWVSGAISGVWALVAILMIGCGIEGARDSAERRSTRSVESAASPGSADAVAAMTPADAPDATTDEVPPTEQIARKLIYTADVDVVVDTFDPLPAEIERLVRRHGGYIAESSIRGSRGDRRSGTWKVRIPVGQFEPFLTAASGIGEVRSLARRSQDVTEEFFDVEARIRNKRVQEAGLLKILEERPGKLEDVLAVERELSRVREEMERMEGRLRLLENLTSLTTVNIRVEEIRNYVPPQAPTFSRRVGRSFTGSLDSLRRVGESLAIGFVALVPWMIVLAIPIAGIAWALRRR